MTQWLLKKKILRAGDLCLVWRDACAMRLKIERRRFLRGGASCDWAVADGGVVQYVLTALLCAHAGVPIF